jgi:hypothetical protein
VAVERAMIEETSDYGRATTSTATKVAHMPAVSTMPSNQSKAVDRSRRMLLVKADTGP